MSIASMTGFARAQGATGAWRWSWELRSVNAKGLDLRLRLPSGFDALDAAARLAAGRALSRGSISGTFAVTREGETVSIRINQPALAAMVEAGKQAAERYALPAPTLDALLAVKGVVEVVEAGLTPEDVEAITRDATGGFEEALAALGTMRLAEGQALLAVLRERLEAMSALVQTAEALPERQADAIRARLEEQVRSLVGAVKPLDPDRLHQEVALLATKADVREELDRLTAHVAAAHALLETGGPVGRKLDFLSQEFNREANTLCSKSNAVALTRIGLDLKLLVDQFREQIQNIE
ncbi:MAG: YicC family protein [Rhizobiales bacterium 17-65-6]|nr:MAG: YicC family protein [Rhizobiales bacterium 12-68-15]OYX87781.1 MAG: YicC family protein [Azorhizobium sp. 32-67-21]OYY12309.1 MAG: YicC family protein [Rhizobiales bacterium 35-68-8]OZA00092.1 MAG: YicC family protein [Rhizobiales bacterium 17-65-6]OZA90721.1 MAG: YicC family protein [Azorhizobium sp. 39-67-5]